MEYTGSCHCGNIKFKFNGDINETMECNCSYCGRTGVILAFAGLSQVQLLTPKENLSNYKFNTQKIDHHFCAKCGCGPLGYGVDPNGNKMAAVNVRCLEGVNIWDLKPTRYNGKDL